ncbi:hypothetical protein HK405_000453, partial [Cladochytrium tenue]
EPYLTKEMSTIKNMCADEVWVSLKDPTTLEEEYRKSCNSSENALVWLGKGVELFMFTIKITRGHVLATDDPSVTIEKEARNEAQWKSWLKELPPSLWFSTEEEHFFEAMEEDMRHWQRTMGLFFIYHGNMCVLMRRRSMLYLRDLSDAFAKQYLNLTLGPASPTELENERAMNVMIKSARAMASLVKLLQSTNAFVHKLPMYILFHILQGALTLLMVERLPVHGARELRANTPLSPRPPAYQVAPSNSAMVYLTPANWVASALSVLEAPVGAPAPGVDSAVAAAAAAPNDDGSWSNSHLLDECLAFLRVISTTRKLALVLIDLLVMLRSDDPMQLDRFDID